MSKAVCDQWRQNKKCTFFSQYACGTAPCPGRGTDSSGIDYICPPVSNIDPFRFELVGKINEIIDYLNLEKGK